MAITRRTGNERRRPEREAADLNAMLREHEELRQRSDQLAAEVHKLEQRVGALAERRTRQRRTPPAREDA